MIGIDEATQHTEFRYRYMFSRLRKPQAGPLSKVPLRMRATANPGGRGHVWVRQRFIDNRTREKNAVFVPAKLADNPTLNAVEYVRSLSMLDPITRAQLLAGDWDAFAGGKFQPDWFYGKDGGRGWWLRIDRSGNRFYEWTGGPKGGIPVGMAWTFIICDPAARAEDRHDNTAIGAFAVMPHGEVLVLEMVREHLDIERIVPRIAELCAMHEPLWVGIESTSFQIAILREAQRHPGIPAVKPLEPEGKSKLVRATAAIIMASQERIFVPVRGPLYPWVEDYISELALFTGVEEEDGLVDAVDVTAYAIQSLQRGGLSMPSIITPEQAQSELDTARGGGIFMA
jgi:phage terminase large subunit-like protein